MRMPPGRNFCKPRCCPINNAPYHGAETQSVIVTGVPVETDLKKFSAMNSGIRMQPCEAG